MIGANLRSVLSTDPVFFLVSISFAVVALVPF